MEVFMQSDYNKFKTMLNDFGIKYEENISNCHKYPSFEPICNDAKEISICEYDGGDKVQGYCGFFKTFEFNQEGKFLMMGVWE